MVGGLTGKADDQEMGVRRGRREWRRLVVKK
jgi:hypothetical protein